MNRRITAVLMITATVLFTVAITVLGSAFEYPDILKEPAADIMAAFRESQTAVVLWFTVLAIGAGLLIPIAIGVGRVSRDAAGAAATGASRQLDRRVQAAVAVGVAAGTVQFIGLSRWPILVPGFARDAASSDPAVAHAAEESFTTAHQFLGTVVGETLGYLLTAAWTLLVVVTLARTLAGRWFRILGTVAAVLVLSGVLSPLELPGIDLANLVGYLLWGAWMIAFGVLLLRQHGKQTQEIPLPQLAAKVR
jgi:Domain of unknown function (DUF4386)